MDVEAKSQSSIKARVHRLCSRAMVVLLVATTLLSFASGFLLNEDEFARVVGSAMDDDDVRTAIAGTAVDRALTTFKVDQTLAAALPEQLSLAASPAIELSKPVVAEAGSQLLALEPAKLAVTEASRSVHRQTTTAVFAEEERDVVINTRPILVVTADQIAGPAGARAAVGLNLPDSATSVNLGSNRNAAWRAVNSLASVAAGTALALLFTLIVYFATAEGKLQAAARLGRPFVTAGIISMLLSFVLALVAGALAESLLGSHGGFSVAGISFGQVSGGAGLGVILTSTLASAARRLLFVGLGLMFITRLFTDHPAAEAFRSAIRHRNHTYLVDGFRALLPDNLRRVQLGVFAAGTLTLWFSADPSRRRTLTVVVLVVLAQLALVVATADGERWQRMRAALGWDHLVANDRTDRSALMQRRRRVLGFACAMVLILWPSFTSGSVRWLSILGLGLFLLTYRHEIEREEPAPVVLKSAPVSTPLWRRPRVTAPLLCLALFVLLLAPAQGADLAQAGVKTGPLKCNGLSELCERPFDEVVFAGAHNAMSAEELGWELANHGTAIPSQLAGGVRALLVDVQKWEVDVSLDELALDPAAADIARTALAGAQTPEDGLWMCHKLCQLGGTPFRDFVADLRAFVETNPDEVIFVVIQDDAEKADIKAALTDGGLDQLAYAHTPGTPWPTLGEMITANERLVFMAENDGDVDGWYQSVYEGNVTETNFRYSVVSDFECAPNRGEPDSPLFLINHWVETGVPVPADADTVNSAAVLRERVAECERVRGRKPGVIAVNFWGRGDLIDVVNQLNRRS